MYLVKDLSKYFGAQTLFSSLTWQIDRFKTTALVGPNGAGKSTLLKIIAGEMEADSGQVLVAKQSLGYLPQEITDLESAPALDLVLSGKGELLDLELQLEEAHRAVEREASVENLELFGHLQERFEDLGGYGLRARAQSILASLGFKNEEFEKNSREFSGGWQMRILLARLLLQSPDLLLLDEPTNHLDLSSLAWLEGFLRNYPGCVLIVSHDRAFLNRIVDGVAALDSNGLLLFPGNYDKYLEARAGLEEQRESLAAQQKRTIADLQSFIDRFRYKASKAKQVQSRVKALEKIEEVKLLENRKRVRFRFPEAERTPQVLIELRNVAKSYDDNRVYDGIDFTLYRGDKVALVAPNGAGKSTLIKILADMIPFEGERILSDRVKIAFFAQHQVDALDFSKTLLGEACELLGGSITLTQIRSALGAFLFTNADMEKLVSVLSGGEKNKLALTKILLQGPNLLLLDEPTNHLDLDSREALEEALLDFTGSLVVISHDRWFIDKICNKIVHIENGQLEIFSGNYSEYEEMQASLQNAELGVSEGAGRVNIKKQRRVESAQLRDAIRKATKEVESRVRSLESEIENLEIEIGAIDSKLSCPQTYQQQEELKSLNLRRIECRSNLDLKMEAWVESQAELEEILSQFESSNA